MSAVSAVRRAPALAVIGAYTAFARGELAAVSNGVEVLTSAAAMNVAEFARSLF